MSAEARPTTSLRSPSRRHAIATGSSSFLNIRVKDIEAVYADLERPGCSIPDAPKHHQYEIRCYIRDPDGHLIEVGQTTDPERDWSPAH